MNRANLLLGWFASVLRGAVQAGAPKPEPDARKRGLRSDLVDFVNGGGGVDLAAGTDSSNAALAASLFNPFLNTFGLSYANFHDLFSTTDLIDDPSNPLFAGVTQLYYAGVNPVSTTGSSADASVVESRNVSNPAGLIAVYDDTAITPQPVPEPGTFGLLGAALCALALAFRRAVYREAVRAGPGMVDRLNRISCQGRPHGRELERIDKPPLATVFWRRYLIVVPLPFSPAQQLSNMMRDDKNAEDSDDPPVE